MTGFDDRTVTLDAPEQLADLGGVLGSRTRLAVLGVLVRATEPLNINEIARRVGVDASPVRTHLEILVKAGLAREVATATGRARDFETVVTGVKLTIEGANAPRRRVPGPLPKAAARVQRRIDGVAKDAAKLEAKARKLHEELRDTLLKEEKKAGLPAAP